MWGKVGHTYVAVHGTETEGKLPNCSRIVIWQAVEDGSILLPSLICYYKLIIDCGTVHCIVGCVHR